MQISREGRHQEAAPPRSGDEVFRGVASLLVGMEACATAHYWARELTKLGHEVRLNACFWLGLDQRITSGPAAIAAALKGRIHGCTRTLRRTSDSSCIAGAVHTWHKPTFRCGANVLSLLGVKRTLRGCPRLVDVKRLTHRCSWR